MTELCDKCPFKFLVSSGEALPVKTAQAFHAKFPGVGIANVLSTTETSADIALLHVTPEVCAQAEKVCAMLPVCRQMPRGVYGGGIVWNNSVSMNSEGRVQHTGWNMEAGYVTGEDADSFTEVDGQRSLRNLSESLMHAAPGWC